VATIAITTSSSIRVKPFFITTPGMGAR